MQDKKIEAAALLSKLQDKVVKIVYFRKWMHAVDVHIPFKPQQSEVKQIEIPQEQQKQEKKTQESEKKTFNLKFGDVLYFKTYLSDDLKGMISGDGIASNKLECVQTLSKSQSSNLKENKSNSIQSKYAGLIFQKCIFKIVPQKKYYFQKELCKIEKITQKSEQLTIDLEEFRKKADEERYENEAIYRRNYGQNVVYGEEVQLVHLYSQCILTLNHQVLAKQNCCREVKLKIIKKKKKLSLEEVSSEYSNFRILSLNSAKNPGQPIFYGDQTIMISSMLPQWKLGVQSLLNQNICVEDGLEVNASEISMPLKVCSYLDNSTQKVFYAFIQINEKEIEDQGIQGKFIQSGDIITIKNRNLGGLLAIKRIKMLSDFLERRDVQFRDYETNVKTDMKQDYFEVSDLRSTQRLGDMYELYIDCSPTNDQNLNALWEIQLTQAFKHQLPTYNSHFLIKHVATGVFLEIDQNQDKKIGLTYDGMKATCKFSLKSKKNSDDPIPYSESAKVIINTSHTLQIQSNYIKDMMIMANEEQRVLPTLKSLKSNVAKTIFLLSLAPTEVAKTANRIYSLTIYLFQFYVFLQEWGMENQMGGKRQSKCYDYNKSFNTQKTLYDEIRQLFQALDNLKLYLTNNNKPSSNEDSQARQAAIRENGIINLLFCILMLVYFMIYGSAQKSQQYYEAPGTQKQNAHSVQIVPDKSPQKIAKLKLDPAKQVFNQDETSTNNNCVEEIYSILLLCIKGNLDSSNYLMKLDLIQDSKKRGISDTKVLNFLLTQLKYHRESVQNLLKESVRYTDTSNDNDTTYLSKWIEQLESINDENIEDQTLFVELLSLIMIDPFENPIPQSQDLCRRLLFKDKSSKPNGKSPFNYSLLQFTQRQIGNNKHPMLQFKTSYSTDDFCQRNEVFCIIYQKFYKKKMQDYNKTLNEDDIKLEQNVNLYKMRDIDMDFLNLPTMKLFVKQEDVKKHVPILGHYENYVLNVLNLYCSLCLGRNHKSLETIRRNCGIDQIFLMQTLSHFSQNQLCYEKCFISLYTCMSVDSDPLVSILNFKNRCYLLEDIQTMDIQLPSGTIFFDTNASAYMKSTDLYQEFINRKSAGNPRKLNQQKSLDAEQGQLDQNDQDYKEYQELKMFAKYIVDKENIEYKVVMKYIDQFCSITYPDHLRVKSPEVSRRNEKGQQINYGLFAKFQLEYILSLLRLIRNAIDLGYNNLATNIRIMKVLPNIFHAMILKSSNNFDSFGQIHQFQVEKSFDDNLKRITKFIDKKDKYVKENGNSFTRNWLLEFFLWTTSNVDDKLLVIKVYLESIALLKTLYALKLNLQLLKYLGFHKENPNCKPGLMIQKIKPQGSFASQILQFNDEEDNKQQQPLQTIDQLDTVCYQQFIDIFGEERMVNFNTLLFNDLCSQEGRSKLNEDLLQLLIKNFNYLRNLTSEMRSIEIIGDDFELDLFSIVNGNNKVYDKVKGPSEMQLEVKKAVKFLTLKPKQDRLSDGLSQAYEKVSSYLQGLIDLFETKLKDHSDYYGSLQNILRNAQIHKILINLIIDPKRIIGRENGQSIVNFYKNLITFYEKFTKNNPINQKEMIQYVGMILDLALIHQTQANDINYIPLKVTRLVIEILSQERTNTAQIEINIKELIDKIGFIGEKLSGMGPFFNPECEEESVEDQVVQPSDQQETDQFQTSQQLIKLSTSINKRGQEKEVIYVKTVVQYLKILKSLTKSIERPSTSIESSKHYIMTSIMQTKFLRFIIEPSNFFYELRIQQENRKQLSIHPLLRFNYIKLHANVIILLSECCHYYRLGIQETQRTLLYEQLKQILLSGQCYYIIKRAYLFCLFEVYINRVNEGNQSNEVVENNEVGEILASIIIPDLDQKKVYQFLEGLVKFKSDNSNKDLKYSIASKKVQYFEKSKEFKSTKKVEDEGVKAFQKQQSILRDNSEYWKYIRDNGLMHFLVCVYDEMKDRVDLEKSEDSTLADEFAIIKDNIQKMKDIFKVLEQDFRMKQDDLNLEQYREIILTIEEIIPQRKITKFGKNFRIGFGPETRLQFEKFDTLNEDAGVEKKIQEQENVNAITTTYKRNMKIYLMRNHIQIDDLLSYVESQIIEGQPEMKDILTVINVQKQYLFDKDLEKIEKEDMLKIQQEKQLKDQQQQGDIQKMQKWDFFKLALKAVFSRKKASKAVDENMSKASKLHQQEQADQENLYTQFEIYISKQIKINKEKLKQEKLILDSQAREENEEIIQNNHLNQEFEKQIKDIRESKVSDEDKRQIMSDSQIEVLLISLQKEKDILSDEELPKFLDRAIAIFQGHEIYLIKICRILLQNAMPSADEMDQMGSTQDNTIKDRFDQFQKYQITTAEANIDKLAILMMSDPNEDIDNQIEAINFLVSLLEYGNTTVQQRILKNMKSDEAQANTFFSFLRKFFMTNIDEEFIIIQKGYEKEQKENQMKVLKDQESHQNTKFEQKTFGLLKLLQVFCETVNVEFQQYLAKQNEDDSYTPNTNIVIEVSNFLSYFLEDNKLKMRQKNTLICQGIETLIEFSTGYQQNRIDICKNKRLFSLLNNKIIDKLQQDFKPDPGEKFFTQCKGKTESETDKYQERNEMFCTLQSFVKLLLNMTQGNNDTKSLQFLLEIVNVKKLLRIMKDIYDQRIQLKQRCITLNMECTEVLKHEDCSNLFCSIDQQFRTDEDSTLISTGFDIFIFLMYMSESCGDCNISALDIFNFDENLDDEEYYTEQNSVDLIQREYELLMQKVQPEQKQKQQPQNKVQDEGRAQDYEEVAPSDQDAPDEKQQLADDLKRLPEEVLYNFRRTDPFFKFYREFIGRIEIQKDDMNLQKVYFQKPFFCKYLTEYIKHHLVYQSNRASDQDRMMSLLENLPFYDLQMVHNQKMTRWKVLDIGAKNWRLLKDISFLLCLVLVFLLVAFYDDVNSQVGQARSIRTKVIYYINYIVTIVQLCLNIIIVVFSAIESYPISISFRNQKNSKKLIVLKNEAGFGTDILTRMSQSLIGSLESLFEESKVAHSYIRQLFLIVVDGNNFYNVKIQQYLFFLKLIILTITVFAFTNPFIYAVLLLDVVKRSEDLQNIIRSITVNLNNLAKFGFLGLVGLLLTAIIGFNYYKDYFNREGGVYADSFILAVVSTIEFGLRNGGGIGDAFDDLPEPSEKPEDYWGLIVFELVFFMLFNVLFLQIIFGIILDTFGALRDARQELLKEVQEKCFICSLQRNDIDTKGYYGWYRHIYLEHNVYHMLFYMIYIKKRDKTKCDALEKYVKQCIENKDTAFFPQEKALQIPE